MFLIGSSSFNLSSAYNVRTVYVLVVSFFLARFISSWYAKVNNF